MFNFRSDHVLQHHAPDRLQSAIHVHGTQHGFQAVHQQRGFVASPTFFLAPAQPQVVPEFQLPRHLDQMFFTN